MKPYRRVGRIVRLKPEAYETYKRLHENCWDEVVKFGTDIGIRNYSIYYKDSLLFSYYEIPSHMTLAQISKRWSENSTCMEWEKIMQTLMLPSETPTGDIWWDEMEEVYHQE